MSNDVIGLLNNCCHYRFLFCIDSLFYTNCSIIDNTVIVIHSIICLLAGSEDEEIEKWNLEENRVRLEECLLEDEERNGEPTLELDDEVMENQLKESESGDIESNPENDNPEDFVDFKKGPTQLLKSEMLNSSMKSDFDRKVFIFI